MTREIKFRLIKDNKIVGYELFLDDRWVYSYPDENFNLGTPFIEHDKKDQYTGLKDKNGKELYEGDIVRILYTDWCSKPECDKRTIEQYKKDKADVKVVQYSINGFYVSYKVDGYMECMEPGKHGYIEVIGNIHENPNLLDD